MKRVILNPDSSRYNRAAVAMFMHFIEIEKQIKGLQTLKRLSNPDTRTSKVLEEVIRRGVSLEELKDLSKVDPELVRKMMEESILGSFFDNKIIGELVKPLFPLRNNDKVTNFAITMLETRPGDIVRKYGEGADGSRAFIVDFKNSIVNYVFQNYMSNFTDAQGNIVNVPTQYKEMTVKPKKGIKLGAEVIDNVIYVDEEAISRDYNLRLYSAENTSPNNYRERGLRPFRTAENAFPTESSFFKYVIEREYQRSMMPFETVTDNKDFKNLKKVLANSISDPKVLDEQAYAAFLNQRALIFAFNREALMKTVNYSYADKIMALINEFSYLKDKYPILNQLTRPSIRTGEKVISLNDSRMLKDAQLAEIYYENLKDLGDPTVKKIEDATDNLRISEMFGILPLVSIYQNGIGYSRFGFNEALPYDSFISVMDTASQLFLEKQLNNKTLKLIYSKIMDKDNKLFKNFVVSPKEFNSPTEVPLPPQIATETPTEEDVVEVPLEVRDELRGMESTTQPSTSIKEGVSDLFESNPKLASIGTPEQYSEYLNTIFPESQVKEILYHGSERSEQSFEKQIPREAYGSNAIYFANKSYAKNFGNLIPALLDITSPLISELKFMRRRLKPGIESPPNTIDAKDLLASNKNNDGLIGTDYSEQENNTYVVREPEQIHILGNEQDIEGFKRFVSQSSTQPNQNSPEGLPPIDRTPDSCG